VRIGRDTLLAAYTYLVGGDHAPEDRSRPIIEQRRQSLGIDVGAGAWLGARVTVLDGVRIGDRAVVGAHAVVRDDVPAGATAVGIPARLVGAAPEA
jgi:acetyltransferase-like isoleucine patch superfamily enzyme